jgi:hypothetical protein
MFEQYVKLFQINWIDTWIDTWMVEAVMIISGALLVILIVCKVMDDLNGKNYD